MVRSVTCLYRIGKFTRRLKSCLMVPTGVGRTGGGKTMGGE
jgi:hypothetical protein